MNTQQDYQRLLVCLDASPRAGRVLAAAANLARHSGGEVILFRAVGVPVEIPAEALSIHPSELPDLLVNKALAELKALQGDVPTGVPCRIRADLGAGWEAICRAAREESVDLIVLGSHGFSGLDRLLGTTAAKVTNHADRSVLIVR